VNKKLILLIIGAVTVCAIIGLVVHFLFPGNGPRLGGEAFLLLKQGQDLENSGDLLAAKAAYQKLVADYPNHKEVAQWQQKTEHVNMKILFSNIATPQTVQYEIKPGDSLDRIAREHRTTVELIRKSNHIAEDKIYPGMKIRLWNVPFTIFADKSSNLLLLKSGEEIIKTYTVATGTNNCTPVGTFKIIEKIVNPPWYKDGRVIPPTSSENILGTRWLGLEKAGYGIHGTTAPQSLGTQATAGCVRMSNRDVEELFSIVPQGTVVTITD
jgi:lipoprotein-anchoring transpeptidase ErfK/SrfK